MAESERRPWATDTPVLPAVLPQPPLLHATLTIITGAQAGETLQLHEAAGAIGRAEDADLVIDDRGVSGRHARITRKGGVYFIEDLGSTNGTFLGTCEAR